MKQKLPRKLGWIAGIVGFLAVALWSNRPVEVPVEAEIAPAATPVAKAKPAPAPGRRPAAVMTLAKATLPGVPAVDEDLSTPRGHIPTAEWRIQRLMDRGELVRTQDVPVNEDHFQRIRVMRTGFKYPLVRVVENIAVDPQTRGETSGGVQAMVADHFLIRLRPGFSEAQLERFVKANGGEIRSHSAGSDRYLIAFDGENPQALDDIVERFARSPMIADPTPDYLVFAN